MFFNQIDIFKNNNFSYQIIFKLTANVIFFSGFYKEYKSLFMWMIQSRKIRAKYCVVYGWIRPQIIIGQNYYEYKCRWIEIAWYL